jgi:hypothetical protein
MYCFIQNSDDNFTICFCGSMQLVTKDARKIINMRLNCSGSTAERSVSLALTHSGENVRNNNNQGHEIYSWLGVEADIKRNKIISMPDVTLLP